MPKLIQGEKKWILDERLKLIFQCWDQGYTDADIARIFFNINRSTITRMKRTFFVDYKKYIITKYGKDKVSR